MRNIRLFIQYEGTKYQGWQKQTSTDNTIQGKLERLLEAMCKHPVEVQGSGRTDAGVHAYMQVANFHTECEMTLSEMLQYINQYLPQDIAVVKIEEAAPRFHSRLNAVGKKYRYLVWNSEIPNVFYRNQSVQVKELLDVETMRKAAEYLLGEHDFQGFTSAKKGKKSTVRTIHDISIEPDFEGQKGMLAFTFYGDGFLYHMIRILMGTLLEIGKGERELETLPVILEEKNRALAGPLVPAKGLTLLEVFYS